MQCLLRVIVEVDPRIYKIIMFSLLKHGLNLILIYQINDYFFVPVTTHCQL